MKKTLFIKNAAILTASSFILRFAGIIFKVWLASLIGSEGIGLYQLVFSVYVLISTFASSGIVTAVTRLIAEELALGSKKGTLKILRRSVELSLIISFLSLIAVFFGAEFIATRFLGDIRAVAALKILPFSLPFMAVSSCIRGYFIARRKATPSALTGLSEQAIRIIAVVLLAKAFSHKGLGASCAAVMIGDVISELLACLILFWTFKFDAKKLSLSGRERPPYKITRKIINISMPITSGRYLNSLLRTAENILVPKELSKYPLSQNSALSQFGMIKGMALPVLFFPSAVLNSISTLLIPEMSEAAAKKQGLVVKSATERIIKLTSLVSFIFAALFWVAGEEIGVLIYKENSVGFLLKVLSPLVPLMYLDSISDGILKGLDQQNFCFRTSVSDSVIRIGLILILLQKSGLNGFIAIMYFSNFLTCFLNVGRLIKISKAEIKTAAEIIFPLLLALSVTFLSDTILNLFMVQNILVYIILLSVISIALYFVLLFICGTVNKDEIRDVLR